MWVMHVIGYYSVLESNEVLTHYNMEEAYRYDAIMK